MQSRSFKINTYKRLLIIVLKIMQLITKHVQKF